MMVTEPVGVSRWMALQDLVARAAVMWVAGHGMIPNLVKGYSICKSLS